MKTFITLILALTLVGCGDSKDSSYGQVRSFFYSDCTSNSYRITQTDEGKMRTITITCVRP